MGVWWSSLSLQLFAISWLPTSSTRVVDQFRREEDDVVIHAKSKVEVKGEGLKPKADIERLVALPPKHNREYHDRLPAHTGTGNGRVKRQASDVRSPVRRQAAVQSPVRRRRAADVQSPAQRKRALPSTVPVDATKAGSTVGRPTPVAEDASSAKQKTIPKVDASKRIPRRSSSTPARARRGSLPASCVVTPVPWVCNAMTQKGVKCTSRSKATLPQVIVNPVLAKDAAFLCGKHMSVEIVPTPQLDLHEYDKYKKYLTLTLSHEAKEQLMNLMISPPTRTDGPGYLYALDVMHPQSDSHFLLKIGHSDNPHRRWKQWSRSCPSRHYTPRGVWPGRVHDSNYELGPQIPCCQRLEQLVLTELRDMAETGPYLESGPPKPFVHEVCECKRTHEEILALPRADKEEFAGDEWEQFVVPVIRKWVRFVKSQTSQSRKDSSE